MNNADFAKLLMSKGGGDDGEASGKGGGFKKRKKGFDSSAVRSKGGRIDRKSLLEGMEHEQRVKKQKGGGDEDDDFMDNDDDDEEEGGGGRGRKAGRTEDEQPAATGDHYGPGKKKDKGAEDEGGYRDRAEERRKGVNPDYEDEIARLVHMDAEKTKYLGGDIKHTHLVKGLDYALLEKVRTEMAVAKEEDETEIAKKEEEEEKGGSAAGQTRKKKSMEAVQTRTLLAKSIKSVLAQTYSSEIKPVDIFRTSALEYTIDGEEPREMLPTLLSRSKAELESEQESESPLMLYTLPTVLLTRITKALTNYRQVAAGVKKRSKRRNKTAEEYSSKHATANNNEGGNINSSTNSKGAIREPVAQKPKFIIGDIFGDSSSSAAVKEEESTKKEGIGGGGGDKKVYFTSKDEEEENGGNKGDATSTSNSIDDTVEKLLENAGLSTEGKKGKDGKDPEIPILFGSSTGKKEGGKGEGMRLGGGGGGDDYYPDSGGMMYGYDSDEEVQRGKGSRKPRKSQKD